MPSKLKVRIIPRSKRNEIAGWRQDALLIRLTAPPVEGAANRMLMQFLSGELRVRPFDVTIISGAKSRTKIIQIESLTDSELAQRLPKPE